MRKWIFYVIFIGIITLLSSCGSNIPSESDVMSDISEYVTIIPVENPFTGLIENQELEITSFVIDKSQTTDSKYDAYCIINMKNNFYQYTKYIVCNYIKYDGDKWELNNSKEYQTAEFAVIENPFKEEDIYIMIDKDKYETFPSYVNAQPKEISFELTNQNDVCCQLVCEIENMYSTSSIYDTIWYSFNGSSWNRKKSNRSLTTKSWNIIGTWKLAGDFIWGTFESTIDSFDYNSLSGSGYCKFTAVNVVGRTTDSDVYRIEDAIITEEQMSLKIKWNDGSYIRISSDYAEANYKPHWAGLPHRIELYNVSIAENPAITPLPEKNTSETRERTLNSEDGRYAIEEYDLNDKLIKRTYYDANDNIYLYQMFEWDLNNNNTKYTYGDGYGTVLGFEVYEYDTNNRLIQTIYYKADEAIDIYEVYKYDSNNNLIESIAYKANGTTDFYKINEYDSNDNLIESITYKANGTIDSYEIHEYDLNGNIIKQTSYEADGTVISYWMYEYDPSGNLIKTRFHDANGFEFEF